MPSLLHIAATAASHAGAAGRRSSRRSDSFRGGDFGAKDASSRPSLAQLPELRPASADDNVAVGGIGSDTCSTHAVGGSPAEPRQTRVSFNEPLGLVRQPRLRSISASAVTLAAASCNEPAAGADCASGAAAVATPLHQPRASRPATAAGTFNRQLVRTSVLSVGFPGGAPGQFAAANLQAAHDSAMVMSKLLDNVLSLSKIESGKMELQLGSFAIVEQLVREPVSVFARVLARKQLRLRVEVSSKVPRLMLGDVDKLRGVLSNFISNAIKVRRSLTGPMGGTNRRDEGTRCLAVREALTDCKTGGAHCLAVREGQHAVDRWLLA